MTSRQPDGPQAQAGRALYAISVVAELAGTGQQNIRLYETRGLLTPARTSGGTRQYSDADIALLLHDRGVARRRPQPGGGREGAGTRGGQRQVAPGAQTCAPEFRQAGTA